MSESPVKTSSPRLLMLVGLAAAVIFMAILFVIGGVAITSRGGLAALVVMVALAYVVGMLWKQGASRWAWGVLLAGSGLAILVAMGVVIRLIMAIDLSGLENF